MAQSADMPVAAAGRLAADIIAAIKGQIVETGRFTTPGFGAFVVRETAKRTALNPKTGEKVVKAGAAMRFKASPALKDAAFVALKKAKAQGSKGLRFVVLAAASTRGARALMLKSAVTIHPMAVRKSSWL